MVISLEPPETWRGHVSLIGVIQLTHLLRVADISVDHPDEKSVITYVVTYYHYFSKMKALKVEGKRIGKVRKHHQDAFFDQYCQFQEYYQPEFCFHGELASCPGVGQCN